MSIKLIVFDLDNTLVDMADVHFEALNMALEDYDPYKVISYENHLMTYNGLPTKVKLKMLGFSESLSEIINKRKQEYTLAAIKKHISPADYKIQVAALQRLKDEGYILYVASNSVRATVHACLGAAGYGGIDAFFSNEDVLKPKPDPSMYVQSMLAAGATPRETLIVEDSAVGIESAKRSGAYILKVNNPKELTYDLVKNRIQEIEACKS